MSSTSKEPTPYSGATGLPAPIARLTGQTRSVPSSDQTIPDARKSATSSKAPTVKSVSTMAATDAHTRYWLETRLVHLVTSRLGFKFVNQNLPPISPPEESRLKKIRFTTGDRDMLLKIGADDASTRAHFGKLSLRSGAATGSFDKTDSQTLCGIKTLQTAFERRVELHDSSSVTTKQTVAWYNSLAQLNPDLPPSNDFVFVSRSSNEAMTRQAMDAFNSHLVNVWEKLGDNYQSERAIKLPTYHRKITKDQPDLRLPLEPEVAILDAGFAVEIRTMDDNPKGVLPKKDSRSWEIVRALKKNEGFSQYKEVSQYLMDISARPPKLEDSQSAVGKPNFWALCNLYFLIIEYKKEENVSAVRQLAMQMTAVLHHNAIFGLHGPRYPIYGFTIEGNRVDMYQGWLQANRDTNKLHSTCIKQATDTGCPIKYDLNNTLHVMNLYCTISTIRNYGCSDFVNKAKEGLTEMYKDIADQHWDRFTMSYDPRWIAEKRTKQEKAIEAAKEREKGTLLGDAQRKALEAYTARGTEAESDAEGERDEEDREDREDASDGEGASGFRDDTILQWTTGKPRKLNKAERHDLAEFPGSRIELGASSSTRMTRARKQPVDPAGSGDD